MKDIRRKYNEYHINIEGTEKLLSLGIPIDWSGKRPIGAEINCVIEIPDFSVACKYKGSVFIGKVLYRQLEKADYPAVQSLISDAFGLDKYVADKKILVLVKKMYLHSCLSEQKYNQVAVYDGQITGVIMGASKQDKNKLSQLSILSNAFKLLYYTMLIWFKIKSEKGALSEVNRAYRELISGMENDFDGVLTLFAVKDTMRGLGIGKELLFKLNDYYSKHNTQRIYLYTDDTCNYGFYEHMGFERLIEQQVSVERKGKKVKMAVYLYALHPAQLDKQ